MTDPTAPVTAPRPAMPYRRPADPAAYAHLMPPALDVVVLAADPIDGAQWAVSFAVEGVVYHDVFTHDTADLRERPYAARAWGRPSIRVFAAICSAIYG